jgi:hypothetical protein
MAHQSAKQHTEKKLGDEEIVKTICDTLNEHLKSGSRRTVGVWEMLSRNKLLLTTKPLY